MLPTTVVTNYHKSSDLNQPKLILPWFLSQKPRRLLLVSPGETKVWAGWALLWRIQGKVYSFTLLAKFVSMWLLD